MTQSGLPFSFPVLPLNVLEQELQELLGIRVSISDLAKPRLEKVIEVYERILQDLNEQAFQKLYTIPERARNLLDYPEIYEESIKLFKLKAALSQVLRVAMGGVVEFELTDLEKPDARRFQRQLSALLNYKKFRDEKLAKFNENQQKVDALTNQLQQLQDENLQITSELKNVQIKRKQDEQETQQVVLEISDLDNRRKVAYDQCQKLQQEIKNAKAVYGQKKNEVTSLKLEFKSAEQMRQSYRDQLVDSHEQLQQNFREVTKSIEVERQHLSETDGKLRNCRKLGEDVKKMCGDVEIAILGAERVRDAIQEKKNLSRGVKTDQQQIQELERAIKLEELKEAHLQKLADMSQQRLNKYTSEKQSKQEGFEKAIAEAKQQQIQLQQEVLTNEQAQVKQNMQMVQSIQMDMQQKQKIHDETISTMKETAQKLSNNVGIKIEYLGRTMEKRIGSLAGTIANEEENIMNLSNVKNQ